MVVTRIGTLSHHLELQSNSMRQQTNLFNIQHQLSTGYVSNDYKGLAQDITTLNNSKSLEANKERYQQNIEFVVSRTQRYQFAMDTLHSQTDTLRTQLLHATSTYDAVGLMQSVRTGYTMFRQVINTEENGQHIFSGSRTDRPPWDDFAYPNDFQKIIGDFADEDDKVLSIEARETSASPVYTLSMTDSNVSATSVDSIVQIDFGGTKVAGQIVSVTSSKEIEITFTHPDLKGLNIASGTSINGGRIYDRVDDIITETLESNNSLRAINIDDQFSIEYGITADPLIRDTMRAVGRLVQYDALTDFQNSKPLGSGQREFMANQLQSFVKGIDSLSFQQTRNGVNQRVLEDTDKRHTDELIYIKKVISDIQDVDMSQVVTRMKLTEVALQASYSMLTKLSSMSLVNRL